MFIMSTRNDILHTIALFFPKNIAFDDINYKISPQYANTLRVRNERLLDHSSKGKYQYEQLCRIFKDYALIDWTDLESTNCYEYRILLHRNQLILDDDVELMKALNCKRLDLFLFISILGKYYYYFINESTLDCNSGEWTFKSIFEPPPDIDNIYGLDKFMQSRGYVKLTTELVQQTINDIETEFFERGKIKVFNCLFTELVFL